MFIFYNFVTNYIFMKKSLLLLLIAIGSVFTAPAKTFTLSFDSSKNVVINGRKVAGLNKSRRAESSGNIMAEEGRTWWYTSQYGVLSGTRPTYEFGIRIGAATELDGELWNKVELIKSAKRIATVNPNDYSDVRYTDWTIDNAAILLGFIKEDKGKVYTRYTDNWKNIDNPSIDRGINMWTDYSNTGDPTAINHIIYDFSGDDDIVVGSDGHFGYLNTVTQTNESYGNHTYTMYHFKNMSGRTNFPFVSEFTAIPEFGTIAKSNVSADQIFFAPFGPLASDGNPATVLRYVTDADNNILYECIGGLKAWDDNEILSTIDAITSEAPARWFNLQGVEITSPTAPGTYIKMVCGKAYKVMMR